MTEPAGEIRSLDRDHDGKYDSDLDCTWTIHMAPNQLVEVTFLYVELEESVTCHFDYLEVGYVACFITNSLLGIVLIALI